MQVAAIVHNHINIPLLTLQCKSAPSQMDDLQQQTSGPMNTDAQVKACYFWEHIMHTPLYLYVTLNLSGCLVLTNLVTASLVFMLGYIALFILMPHRKTEIGLVSMCTVCTEKSGNPCTL